MGRYPHPVKGHFPAITEPKPLAQLLKDIDSYAVNFVGRTALQLQPLIFARPANLAAAEWAEFDLEAAEWRIAGDKMKTKEAHIVPLIWSRAKHITVSAEHEYLLTKKISPYTARL